MGSQGSSSRPFVTNPSARTIVIGVLAALATVALGAVGGASVPELRAISSRLDGGLSTVRIEATEPVAYVTSQPDPRTVLVDLRNVRAGAMRPVSSPGSSSRDSNMPRRRSTRPPLAKRIPEPAISCSRDV